MSSEISSSHHNQQEQQQQPFGAEQDITQLLALKRISFRTAMVFFGLQYLIELFTIAYILVGACKCIKKTMIHC